MLHDSHARDVIYNGDISACGGDDTDNEDDDNATSRKLCDKRGGRGRKDK